MLIGFLFVLFFLLPLFCPGDSEELTYYRDLENEPNVVWAVGNLLKLL